MKPLDCAVQMRHQGLPLPSWGRWWGSCKQPHSCWRQQPASIPEAALRLAYLGRGCLAAPAVMHEVRKL
jgi:hypothetical protein